MLVNRIGGFADLIGHRGHRGHRRPMIPTVPMVPMLCALRAGWDQRVGGRAPYAASPLLCQYVAGCTRPCAFGKVGGEELGAGVLRVGNVLSLLGELGVFAGLVAMMSMPGLKQLGEPPPLWILCLDRLQAIHGVAAA